MAVSDPSRVLFLGDTHGVLDDIRRSVEKAVAHGCDTVFQVGDFGLWPPALHASEFIAGIDTIVDTYGIERLVWIDGNHDWHDRIDQMVANPVETSPEGFIRYAPASKVWYCPRGTVWIWQGTTFGALGGAVSIDQHHRRVGTSWWQQEAPTETDLARLISNADNQRVDVLITHDAPTIPPGVQPMRLPSHIEADCAKARDILDLAITSLHPQQVIHGHWHKPLNYMYEGTDVTGLADASAPMDLCTWIWGTQIANA